MNIGIKIEQHRNRRHIFG